LKGAKFHDGKPVTAADVKANFDRILSPPKGSTIPFAALYHALGKVETPDDYTVKMSLKYPQAAFLDMVALPYMVMFPKHILDAKGDMKKDMVGSGPFKFKEYVRGVSVEVVRNPDYFVSGRPYLDGIKTYVITDTAAMFSALRTGQVLMAGVSQLEVGPAELEILKKEVPGIVTQVRAVPLLPSFVPNVKRKPWDDVRVRRAVSLAADRQGALKVLAQGLGEMGSYNMPGLWGIPKEELLKLPGFRQAKDADLAEAKRLLAEAGYPKGFKVTIKPRQVKAMVDIAIYMKNELAKLGIEAAVEPVEAGAHKVLLLKGDFEATAFRDGSPGWDPDVIFGEYFVTGAGKNYGQWSDPKVDELF
ncbi:MAG: ABC transporter substrate-binding protein, partial [Chloroflexota bacterium]|nr:ABC transporter substrate-binding protein [Chloroflexota bacterium]